MFIHSLFKRKKKTLKRYYCSVTMANMDPFLCMLSQCLAPSCFFCNSEVRMTIGLCCLGVVLQYVKTQSQTVGTQFLRHYFCSQIYFVKAWEIREEAASICELYARKKSESSMWKCQFDCVCCCIIPARCRRFYRRS